MPARSMAGGIEFKAFFAFQVLIPAGLLVVHIPFSTQWETQHFFGFKFQQSFFWRFVDICGREDWLSTKVLCLPSCCFWKQLRSQDVILAWVSSLSILSSDHCVNLGWGCHYSFFRTCTLPQSYQTLLSWAVLFNRTFSADGNVLPNTEAIIHMWMWTPAMWLVCLINWIFKFFVNYFTFK